MFVELTSVYHLFGGAGMLAAGVFDVPGVGNGLGTALIDGNN